MAHIARFCIDRYEDHLVVVDADAGVAPYPHYERPPRDMTYRAVSAAGAYPQAYISRLEADQACRNADKRLCTLTEWYRACRGPRATTWPYGNTEVAGRCNTSKPHLLSRMFGTNPQAWKYEEHFNNPQLDQEPGFLARTGEYTQCASSESVYDMIGNLHEWVSDVVDDTLPQKVELQEDILKKVGPRHGNAIFMGGFFSTTREHGPGCRFTTIGHEARYHDYSTGFRCCKDAAGRAE